jgi:hypothetical protein
MDSLCNRFPSVIILINRERGGPAKQNGNVVKLHLPAFLQRSHISMEKHEVYIATMMPRKNKL